VETLSKDIDLYQPFDIDQQSKYKMNLVYFGQIKIKWSAFGHKIISQIIS